jgi:hypothetical protein
MAYEWDEQERERQRKRTEEINAGNPGGEDPTKPYVDSGDTGGHLAGIGTTIGEGRSTTQADASRFYDQGVAKYGKDAVDSFLSRNKGDFSRIDAGLADLLEPASAGQATSQYSGGGAGYGMGGMGDGGGALQALLEQLQGQQRQQQEQQSSLRQILMGQLGQLQQPVSAESPGIKEALAGNRIGLQRGTEQQRAEIAERRAYDGSGGLGSRAYATDVDRLLQRQGEAGARYQGEIMWEAAQQRQQQLQTLLTQAMALGDAESARAIQQQLQALQMQQQNSQFYSGLGQNQSQFLDQMGFNYAGLNANSNNAALLALIGAL